MSREKGYEVSVHFATSSSPRVVLRTDDESLALREARAYTSDAKAVTIRYPDGSTRNLKG